MEILSNFSLIEIGLIIIVIGFFIAWYSAWSMKEYYRCRVFELSDGKEGSNLVTVKPTTSPPEPPHEKKEIIEAMVTAVMEDFDFDRVHNVMAYLDWRWSIGNGEYAVPSSYRLMKMADELLHNVAKYYNDGEFHASSSGGFMASLDNDVLGLQFILEETTTDHHDYIEYYSKKQKKQ